MKKIVIFYSRTAGGHLRAAEAIADKLKKINPALDIKMLDGLEKTNFGFKINPATFYGILSIKLNSLYNLLYSLTDNPIGIKALRVLIKGTWGNQFRKLIEVERPDLIITTHHFISPSTIHNLRKKSPFVTVVTDLGKPHRIWFDKEADKIITPTPQITQLAKILLDSGDDQIIELGYPLKDEFKPKASMRQRRIKNTLLVVGGGTGAGRIQDTVKILLEKVPDKKLIVICGFNKTLYKSISKLNSKKLKVYQFVDNIYDHMLASDIVISKAGPGTIIEAAQMKKPMIITDWVGIQEKENVHFVLKNNLGIYCPNIDELSETIDKIYKNYSRFIHKNPKWSGLTKIAKFLNRQLSN